MPRTPNTTVSGGAFDFATRLAVWNKGIPIPGLDPGVERMEACSARIRWADYGLLTNKGWEIDHAYPVAAGGSDALANLQPLQWQNNRHKGDTVGRWTCAMSA